MAEVLAPLRSVLARLEPNDIPLPEVAGIWQLFSLVRRLAGNGETLLAGRVAEAREWARSGYATPEEWMAAKAGVPIRVRDVAKVVEAPAPRFEDAYSEE